MAEKKSDFTFGTSGQYSTFTPGSGGIYLSTTPSSEGFSFTKPAPASSSFSQSSQTKQVTVTNTKAWIGILGHSSYHNIQEMSMHGKKIDTLLIASLGNCSKMEIQPTATAFAEIATKNDLQTPPTEILRQLNDVVKIKISAEEAEEGRKQSPEKLEQYIRWISDPGMISTNRDVYYEKWYDFTYGFKYDGFVKLCIELDGVKQVLDVPVTNIHGYPKITKTLLLQYILSVYPTLQEIVFVDFACTGLPLEITPQHFKPGILGGKKLIFRKGKIGKYGSYSVSTQNRHRPRSRCTRHVHRSNSTRRNGKLGIRRR